MVAAALGCRVRVSSARSCCRESSVRRQQLRAAEVPALRGSAVPRAGPRLTRTSGSGIVSVRAAPARGTPAVHCSASASDAAQPAPASGGGLLARVKDFFGGAAKLDKKKLAALGTSALLSYGWISNLNAITLLIVAWVTFTKTTGLSPLAAGQWPGYLAAYAGLYAVIGNALRPVRFSISVAIAPFFDRLVTYIQTRLNVAKPVAFGVTVFLVNVCGSFSYLFLGLFVATTALGLPLLP